MNWNVLVINPGSTSTKIGLFRNMKCVEQTVVRHNSNELAQFTNLAEQIPLRLSLVNDFLESVYSHTKISSAADIDAFIGRGGLIGPVSGGTWVVNSEMISVLENNKFGTHASNLGALLVSQLARAANKPAWIVDPPSVDEMTEIAKVTGMPSIRRKSVFHALNQKAVARMAAARLNCNYEDINLIVCHAGGGISVGAHCKGRVIDVNNALEEGPFSPERAGSLPSLSLMEFAEYHKYDSKRLAQIINGRGGLVAWTGTSDTLKIENEQDKRSDYKFIYEAMAYNIAKEIASLGACLDGDVQAIVLTGGLAFSQVLNDMIIKKVRFIAPVLIYPGEKELEALAAGGLMALNGETCPLEYKCP